MHRKSGRKIPHSPASQVVNARSPGSGTVNGTFGDGSSSSVPLTGIRERIGRRVELAQKLGDAVRYFVTNRADLSDGTAGRIG